MLNQLRYHAYRFKYRFGRTLPLTKPVDVSLELSSACNMACQYCYHSDPKNLQFKTGFMKFEVAEKIIREAADLGVHALKMNWKGESTLNPKFAEITQLAKSLARGSTFLDRLTNSNFKFSPAKEYIFEGLACQTKVKVSFDSFRKEVFEKQRNLGKWDITSKNIDIFYNHPARIKSETKLVIQAVRTKLNADEDIAGEVKRRWPEAEVSIRDMVAGRVNKDVSEFEHRARDASERQSCVQAHVRLIFNHEGFAFPCCPDVGEQLCIGDIRTQSLGEIFNGHPAQALRRQLKAGSAFKQEPCKSCSSFETFRGFKPKWDS